MPVRATRPQDPAGPAERPRDRPGPGRGIDQGARAGPPDLRAVPRLAGRRVQRGFGYSFTSRTPVQELVVPALGVSISLAMRALLFALVVALPLGTWAATARGGKVDNAITFVSQSAVSAPEYWVGPVMVLIFARYLGWLPVQRLARARLHRDAGVRAGAATVGLLHPGDPGGDDRRAERAVHHRRPQPGPELPAHPGPTRDAQQHAPGDDACSRSGSPACWAGRW